MHVTVAICTWNRAALLDRTLTQLRELRIPAGTTWELLVVNNNSPDDTAAVLARHANRLPLRPLFEAQQGLSAARNRAVAEAQGDLVLWTDDDVLVDPDWLGEYVRAADRCPEAGYFGGTIDPWFEVAPPKWLRDNLDLLQGPMVIRQFGDLFGPLPRGQFPFGANMAFRRRHLLGRPFDTRFGYVGNRLGGGEETAVFCRLETESVRGVWVSSARVRHFIPRRRATTRYLWDWFVSDGQVEARTETQSESTLPPATLFGYPRYLVRIWAKHRLRSLLLAPISSRRWLYHFSMAARTVGMMREHSLSGISRGSKVVQTTDLGSLPAPEPRAPVHSRK
jgi:glycosyltransferase involved in cell wall biosynthesis